MPTASIPISGPVYAIGDGDYAVEVAAVGASLRMLRYQDRDLVLPFDAERLRPAMSGAVLAPWPNRIADARYVFADKQHQLPMNEVETGAANHGLAAWLLFEPVAQSAQHLHLRATVQAQPGYPWRIQVDVMFSVGTEGLDQEIIVTNESSAAAPVGVGGHPYLIASLGEQVDSWSLRIPAEEVLAAAGALSSRAGTVNVAAAPALDFRMEKRIDRAVLNHAFTGLRRVQGIARVQVRGKDGGGAEISWDDRCPWVQVYTADEGVDGVKRGAIAVEPMSCPPGAFQSGTDVVTLLPGSSTSVGWRIRALLPEEK